MNFNHLFHDWRKFALNQHAGSVVAESGAKRGEELPPDPKKSFMG